MSNISKSNIPSIRLPLSQDLEEQIEKFPSADSDNVGNKWQPVYIVNKKFVASDGVPSKMQVDRYVTEDTGYRIAKLTIMYGNPDSPIKTEEHILCAPGGGGGGGSEVTLSVPLLTPMWFDHKINGSKTWIRSRSLLEDDPISTNTMYHGDGSEGELYYQMVYEHLYTDWNASTTVQKTGANADSYTLSDNSTVTVEYRLAEDGHKICSTGQIGNLNKIFADNAIGSAWYYVLDTTNKMFELPRSKYGLHGSLNYVKNPSFNLPEDTGTAHVKSEKHYLYFHTGTDITSDMKADKCTPETPGNVALLNYEGNLQDSKHGIVPDSGVAAGTDLVTVNYLKTQTVSFDSIYPVGSVYITMEAYTQETFPFPGNWVRIAEGKCLWGASSTNTDLGDSVSAGLPKPELDDPGHTHSSSSDFLYYNYGGPWMADRGHASSKSVSVGRSYTGITVQTTGPYGQSDTVQPPALKVAFWQRTA